MKMNAASMVNYNNKGFKFKTNSEKCIKLCSSENRQIYIKGVLNHNKRQDIAKFSK